MGLFDKIKDGLNKMTGNTATVTIQVVGEKLNEPVKINVTAVVKDQPLDVNKIYIQVKSVEKVTVPKREISSEQVFDVNIEKEIYKMQVIEIAPAQKLEAGQTYNWTYDLTLNPQLGAKPTYLGMYVSHEWMFYAGLDVKGNDPDSGWHPQVLI